MHPTRPILCQVGHKTVAQSINHGKGPIEQYMHEKGYVMKKHSKVHIFLPHDA